MFLLNSHALGRHYFPETFQRGHTGTAYFNVRNNFDEELEDVNVKVYIYELGLLYSSSSDDIEANDHELKRVNVNIPKKVPVGKYLVRISAGNDHFRDVEHAYITIA